MPVNDNGLIPGSYSILSTYEQCPAKARWRYIAFMPTSKSPQAQRGSDIHASAEGFIKGEKNTIRSELSPIKDILVKVRHSKPLVEYRMAMSRWFKSETHWRDKLAWFRLVLDSLYFEGKTIFIQEWKTGKEYDDHFDQREIYSAVVLAAWPEFENTVATTFYIDQKGKPRTLQTDRQQGKLVIDNLNGKLERMASDKVFPPRPGYYCRWCDFSRYKGGPCRVG